MLFNLSCSCASKCNASQNVQKGIYNINNNRTGCQLRNSLNEPFAISAKYTNVAVILSSIRKRQFNVIHVCRIHRERERESKLVSSYKSAKVDWSNKSILLAVC